MIETNIRPYDFATSLRVKVLVKLLGSLKSVDFESIETIVVTSNVSSNSSSRIGEWDASRRHDLYAGMKLRLAGSFISQPAQHTDN